MKKGKKLLVTASLVSTAMTIRGCRFLPWMNENADVYGPPPDNYVTMTPVPEMEEESGSDDTPVPEKDEAFSPEGNLSQCMYGPPLDRELIRKNEEK